MVNIRPNSVIDQVQIIDIENAAYLPKGRCIKGMLAGNDNWRSPEGHFKGELNKPSDIYSFGAVVSESRVNCGERYLSNKFAPRSVSMLCLVVSSSGQTMISGNTSRKAPCLCLSAYNVKSRTLETRMG